MIVIVDYGMGNLKSVANACRILGKPAKISDCPDIINRAKKIIFPGVGHFGKTVKELKKRKIFNTLKERIKEGIPYLGICIGMQVLFEQSLEAPGIKGLGVIKGRVKRFKAKNLIVPHMGWNQIKMQSEKRKAKNGDIFKGIADKSFFYFVHSYYCEPEEKSIILTTTNYGLEFASSIHKENIWAVQFHVEKSQDKGLKVFDNFLKI